MLNTRIILIAALLATLSGCASSPRYTAADNAYDYGYSSRQIAEDRYRVSFNGSRRAGLEETRDYALLRAAQLTLVKDYDWFVIVDRETSTVTEGAEPRSGFAYERGYHTQTNCGLLGCSRSTRPVSRTTWRIDTSRPTEKHNHSIEIRMGKGEMPDEAYDASEVVRRIETRA